VIGTNCWLGHDVSVVGKVKIGHGCVIGANTVVTNDIPPFSMVVGNPGRIIKTFNFETNAWEKGAKFNSSLYSDEEIYRNYLNSNFNDLPLGYYPSSSKMGDL
jgi:serine acetyltransferase